MNINAEKRIMIVSIPEIVRSKFKAKKPNVTIKLPDINNSNLSSESLTNFHRLYKNKKNKKKYSPV
tara:strand:- start:769 stop:966 length:198 start_codon:yes stop_codon:yes gene_type:complete